MHASKSVSELVTHPVENLILCDLVLTWPFSVIELHGVRLQNAFDFLILRARVILNMCLMPEKNNFDSGDLSWPFVAFCYLTLKPART